MYGGVFPFILSNPCNIFHFHENLQLHNKLSYIIITFEIISLNQPITF